jgi:hypothetical protein
MIALSGLEPCRCMAGVEGFMHAPYLAGVLLHASLALAERHSRNISVLLLSKLPTGRQQHSLLPPMLIQ